MLALKNISWKLVEMYLDIKRFRIEMKQVNLMKEKEERVEAPVFIFNRRMRWKMIETIKFLIGLKLSNTSN